MRRRTFLTLPLLAAAGPASLRQGFSRDGTAPGFPPDGLLRFGVIGDSGTGAEPQRRVARAMLARHQRNPWEFVLMLGDNVYENGHPRHFERKFIGVYRGLMDDGVRFHATLGNHDMRHNDGRDQLREKAFGYIGGQDEYEFAAGPELPGGKRLARLVCLNSNRWIAAARAGGSRQLAELLGALRERLKETNRYQWNVFYFHHPIHSFVKRSIFPWGSSHGSSRELQEVLEPELQGKADLVLAGHDHFYQKIRPVDGVHHIVSGAAGKLRGGARRDHPQVEYAAVERHFVEMSVTADMLHYAAIGDGGAPFHSGTIAKKPDETGQSPRYTGTGERLAAASTLRL